MVSRQDKSLVNVNELGCSVVKACEIAARCPTPTGGFARGVQRVSMFRVRRTTFREPLSPLVAILFPLSEPVVRCTTPFLPSVLLFAESSSMRMLRFLACMMGPEGFAIRQFLHGGGGGAKPPSNCEGCQRPVGLHHPSRLGL